MRQRVYVIHFHQLFYDQVGQGLVLGRRLWDRIALVT